MKKKIIISLVMALALNCAMPMFAAPAQDCFISRWFGGKKDSCRATFFAYAAVTTFISMCFWLKAKRVKKKLDEATVKSQKAVQENVLLSRENSQFKGELEQLTCNVNNAIKHAQKARVALRDANAKKSVLASQRKKAEKA